MTIRQMYTPTNEMGLRGQSSMNVSGPVQVHHNQTVPFLQTMQQDLEHLGRSFLVHM